MVGQISNGQFLFAYALATVVGVAVFLHADRNGSRHATAWGIGVFLFLAIVLPIYVLHARRARRGAARE